jgi:anti-sigma factor RsiW
MDPETLHGLTAAYALDALDPEERDAFEEHLAGCERCRVEVAELAGAA